MSEEEKVVSTGSEITPKKRRGRPRKDKKEVSVKKEIEEKVEKKVKCTRCNANAEKFFSYKSGTRFFNKYKCNGTYKHVFIIEDK
ncbi:hypothetical protein P0Y35_11760 [Kiritimatiellaeota bacterium B1221]|nr:hypothetical protein [Kiritimatiellaeota bacterium B1221]